MRLRAKYRPLVRSSWLSFVVVGCILGSASPLWAQDASVWLNRGRDALRKRDAAGARWAFGEGLDRAEDTQVRWRLLLGFALANELDGETLEAVYAYRRFLRAVQREPLLAEQTPWPARRERALSDVRRLEQMLLKRYAKVAIESSPPGAKLIVDGDATEHVTPAVMYLSAGTHAVRLEREGHAPERIKLTVAAGERPLLQPKLAPVEPEAVQAPVVVVQEVDLSPWMRFSGALSIALGGALGVAGGALHASALRSADELRSLAPVPETLARDNALRTRIDDYQAAYVACYGVGGLFLATGVGLLIADAVTDGPTTTAIVAPVPGGFVTGLGGRW